MICRRELEAELLDKDAASLSNRFDLEAQTNELTRLKRRVKELESALAHAERTGAPLEKHGKH